MIKIILKSYGFEIFAYRLHSILIIIGLNQRKNRAWSHCSLLFSFSHFILKRRGQTTDIRDYGEGKWWKDFEEGK